MQRIPCVLMRGGTSKGPFFHARDLPANIAERDELLIDLMGSGHELEIDGIGGGSPQTSKVAIVSPSPHPEADVDYLFVQVMVGQRRVDTAPNCGNMLCAVGPFAIEQGLVEAQAGKTLVRIRNLNTNTFVDALVETPGGVVRYEGRTAIDGVPGTAAPVLLTFLDAVGSKTGRLFPTGSALDVIDGVAITCIDMAMPMMIVEARQLGVSGSETPAWLDADTRLLQRLEALRRRAGRAMGLGDVSGMVIPKPVLISPPQHGGTLQVRYFMPHNCHRALAITGAIGLATACVSPGSVAMRMIGDRAWDLTEVRLEHPCGVIDVALSRSGTEGQTIQASVVRTARRLFSGFVYVSSQRKLAG
ncbi:MULTISPECIES: 4-oxalomesaconate tautomerase [Pseudomonas aeruginosa group]|uniref:4-oxalomesaconate tautomerase n=1 Tax=Pseudomonas aeruginosa group TaxID=136841 RepID=UPI0009A41D00|nr:MULTISPECIES: 4-oxalomesaconate tautomerase [Pseudomonas aeruginosa group]KAB0743575.1 4-oxalomesaconate tautomerase [Pseudomonas aeruginosa]MBG4065659.1 4-oxalomesaconate tautomerase [Pseudomonas aeruginosa]MBG5598867.1 4-oxalomesaconate tautomerase [Pseudomonas aeruginosa]MBH3670942.1 4-oxalomesaconate tautomerase [Pseudomonas aeruginosa]MBH9435433.1 4-oxalomesaconate tautomerase [Pseudomonas aeruginosa]